MIVLIAEDNEMLSLLWSRALQAEGFEVRVARDGETALNAATEDPPDLILMDIMMPKLDGLEVMRRLSRSSSAPPVIFVTCLSRVAERDEAARLSAVDYLIKGHFTLYQLVDRVRRLMHARKAVA